MYIADGDYIKDIEVNDLRNRYTLTKGSTQKMVNILVMSTDTLRLLYPSTYKLYVVLYLIDPVFRGNVLKLTMADLAHINPLLATADLHCVTSRSKKKLAPVRNI